MGLLAAFGGGILSSLLLQDPKRAPIALLASNSVGVTWTVCWWLVNYLPGGLVAKLLRLRPFKLVAKARPFCGLGSPVLTMANAVWSVYRARAATRSPAVCKPCSVFLQTQEPACVRAG